MVTIVNKTVYFYDHNLFEYKHYLGPLQSLIIDDNLYDHRKNKIIIRVTGKGFSPLAVTFRVLYTNVEFINNI